MALDWSEQLFFPEVTEPLIVADTGTLHDLKSTLGKTAPASVILFTGVAPVVDGLLDGVLLEGTNVGRRIMLLAQGGDLQILHESSGSRAENRITTGGSTVTVSQGTGAWLHYDAVNKRWRLSSGGTGGGGGLSDTFFGNVSTTDATPTVLPLTLPIGRIDTELIVTGKSFAATGVWKHHTSPSGTVLTFSDHPSSASSWDVSFDGTTITVTGSTSIDWKAKAVCR